MRVLIGCECSGSIRRAFRDRGHEAFSCDLAPAEDGSPFHLEADLLTVLREPWDLVIAHPPCKYLSVSGMHWTTRGFRDPQETVKAIAFAEAIWNCAAPKVCIENPTSVLSTRSSLGKMTQRIQPYEFGHDASKGTCLWLRGLPKLKPDPAQFVHGRIVTGPDGKERRRWANQTDGGQNRLGPSPQRSADRARTYPGIARSMAEQWG